jgi:hypothetical protein
MAVEVRRNGFIPIKAYSVFPRFQTLYERYCNAYNAFRFSAANDFKFN